MRRSWLVKSLTLNEPEDTEYVFGNIDTKVSSPKDLTDTPVSTSGAIQLGLFSSEGLKESLKSNNDGSLPVKIVCKHVVVVVGQAEIRGANEEADFVTFNFAKYRAGRPSMIMNKRELFDVFVLIK